MKLDDFLKSIMSNASIPIMIREASRGQILVADKAMYDTKVILTVDEHGTWRVYKNKITDFKGDLD